MGATDAKQVPDNRSALIVLRQFEKVMSIKRDMVRMGLVGEDATAREVVDTMRAQVPPDLFGDAKLPVK